MAKQSQFDQGYEEGFKLAEEEYQDLSKDEFALLAYNLSKDHKINHENAGILISKLANHTKETKIRIEKK